MTKQSAKKCILQDDFKDIVFKISETGALTVDLSKAKAAKEHDITIITPNGPVQLTRFSAMFGETNISDDAVDAIRATPTIESFSPDNKIIRAGQVQLNKISQYLTDLPDSAMAEFLVAPQDLRNIDGDGLGTWFNSIRRVRDIKGYHGLDGMQIFDRPENDPDVKYEKAWAEQIKAAFNQATASGKSVTTGLFIPTKELVKGRNISLTRLRRRGYARVKNNLYSLKDKIAREGDCFVTEFNGVDSDYFQWASTESPNDSSKMYADDFEWGHGYEYDKDYHELSSRPVALVIQPPA